MLGLIAATAARLGCADRLRTVAADVPTWVRARPRELLRADICFIDAPYRDDEVLDVLTTLGENPPPTVVCEHHRARRLPESIGRMHCMRQAGYGTTQLSFFARTPGAQAEADEDPTPG
jgi:16S rRNA G966 N2-methylase RsmD